MFFHKKCLSNSFANKEAISNLSLKRLEDILMKIGEDCDIILVYNSDKFWRKMVFFRLMKKKTKEKPRKF